MFRRFALVTVASLALAGACNPISQDLLNLLTAGQKLATNPNNPPIGDLTAAEWLAISRSLPELAARFPELGIPADKAANAPQLDEQLANDIVAWMDEQNVETVSDLQERANQIANNEIQATIPDSLRRFVDALGHALS
ncbi:MAG: hypothetical protein HY718_07715 [Planctomycetes bacterium]|nr:hypothetical protein [Planctomycetota bacterium]